MDSFIFEKIIVFASKFLDDEGHDLSRETRIEEDLGIMAADAVDFILAYGKYFNVDLSYFMAAAYFEPEGMNGLLPKSVPNKKTLTLGHLEKGVIAGHLDENVIQGTSENP